MTEQFHNSNRLPQEKLLALIKRSNHPALLHFIVMYTLFLAMAVWLVFNWERSWWEWLLSLAGFGIMCCSVFACEHETVHNTAFKSLFLNQLAARLVGLAHIYPCTIFRELHFTHHRYTHIPGKDPEISLGNKPGPSVVGSVFMYLAWLTGLPLLLFKVGMVINGSLGLPEPIRQKIYPFIRPEVRWAVVFESLYILAFYVGIALLAVYVHTGFWGIYIGQAVGHSFLSVYLVPEHNGLPHDADNIMDKTRSMHHTNPFIKWLMWNMPYHAEHHAYPAVPFHALPQLHKELESEIKHQPKNYTHFHLNLWKKKGAV